MPEATPTQLTLDEELAALVAEPEKKAAEPSASATPAAAETPLGTTAETPAAAAPEEKPPVVPTLEEKLKSIDEPPATPAAPALTEEQRTVLAAIPDPQTAARVTELANGYHHFTSTFASGNFDAATQMLEQWNPAAWSAFEEHIYQKKVASGEWVDRWVSEKEGGAHVSQGMRNLQQEIAALKAKFTEQETGRQREAAAARETANAQALVSHLTRLFNQIEFAPADRRWVASDIYSRIGNDPAVRDAIRSGDPEALKRVNPIFKAAVKEYVERDQVKTAAKETTVATQSKHLPLAQTAAVTPSTLPDKVDDVPQEKLDQWMDEQLSALKRQK